MTRSAHSLISGYVLANASARIICYPNCRVTRSRSCEYKRHGDQSRPTFHVIGPNTNCSSVHHAFGPCEPVGVTDLGAAKGVGRELVAERGPPMARRCDSSSSPSTSKSFRSRICGRLGGLPDGGSCDAHTANSRPTHAAGRSDFRDHAVRLRNNRRGCHSLRRH